MNIIRWNPDLECGIPLIDEQHKSFFKKLNSFVVKVRAGASRQALEEEFKFLECYLLYHFQCEESFQKTSNYPLYRQHQASHDQLRYKTKSASTLLSDKVSFSHDELENIYMMLLDWVTEHISKEDLDFSKYYKENNVDIEGDLAH